MSTITKEFTKERLEEIAEDGFLKHGESKALARIALASLEAEKNAEPPSGNSPVVPDGWVLVPKEPTPAMLDAAWVSHGIYHASAYRTMLAAAPQQEVK